MNQSDRGGIKATRTSFEIIEAIGELDGAGISELARHLDRSKGGIYKHVHTLADIGYLVETDGTYRLGLGLWSLGATVRQRMVPDRVESVVNDLAASVGHVASLVRYENGQAVVAYVQSPTDTTIQPIREGESVPLHATASGKAILAFLPEEEQDAVLDGQLEAYTDATRTNVSAIEEAIEAIRQQRLARDEGEYRADVECVGAPIVDGSGYPRGAVAVSGGSDELVGRERDADASLIVSASKSIENELTD